MKGLAPQLRLNATDRLTERRTRCKDEPVVESTACPLERPSVFGARLHNTSDVLPKSGCRSALLLLGLGEHRGELRRAAHRALRDGAQLGPELAELERERAVGAVRVEQTDARQVSRLAVVSVQFGVIVMVFPMYSALI
eukprot:Selendium_serpulae@DN3344_c0_g1_i2.p1